MLRRTAISLDQYILRAPVKSRTKAPQCALCLCDVDSEEVVDGAAPGLDDEDGRVYERATGETVRVLVKHHGAEELRTIDFGSREWGHVELRKWMQRIKWFNPLEDDQAGKLQR
jgi:hypothetical protein